MKIIFYKGRKTLFAHAIFWFQMWILRKEISDWEERKKIAESTHIERRFSDEVCFGSSEVDGGVRPKNIALKPNNWEIIDIGGTKAEEKFCREFYEARKHQEWTKTGWWVIDKVKKLWFGNYDRMGIVFAQAARTNWFLRKHKWFCSEIDVECQQALMRSDIITKEMMDKSKVLIGITPHMVSPGQYKLMLTK